MSCVRYVYNSILAKKYVIVKVIVYFYIIQFKYDSIFANTYVIVNATLLIELTRILHQIDREQHGTSI